MSLIHEALRKARRDREDEDARGVVYARGLTGRRRSHGLGTGILLGALLAVVAGAAVSVAMWLWLGHRSGATPATPGSGSAATAAGVPGPGPSQPQPVATPATAATSAAATPAPGASGGSLPAAAAASRPGGEPAPAAATPPAPGTGQHEQAPPAKPGRTNGERVYDVEADLGYASLAVDYVVDRPTDPFASINGIDVRVGSTIEGFTVEAITATEVRLRDARGPLVLKVP